jgi:CBS domain-containing protein
MKARDIMSANVVTVGPGAAVREIARLLLDNQITAMPVVDQNGAPIGMISEGDLIAPDDIVREARRNCWLTLLAEGEPLSSAFLEWLHSQRRTAGYLMSKPVISVDQDADVGEVARLLAAHHIKRVPVVRNGRVIGIVSRGDLLRALFPSDPDTQNVA